MADETLAKLYEVRGKMERLDIMIQHLGPLPPVVATATRNSGRSIEFLIRLNETGAKESRKEAYALLDDEFRDAPRAWRDKMSVIIARSIRDR